MKLACLILAYSGAPVLARALPVYRSAGWDVFVHLDAKADRTAYTAALGNAAEMCRFVDDPVAVFWAGYSMVRAALRLIQDARAAGTYDRFLLLSDDTMPLFPPGDLNARLAAQGDLITAVGQGPGSKNHADYPKFFFLDHPATTARDGRPRSGEIDERLQTAVLEIAALRTIGKKPVTLYYGSQFWCLTAATIEFILKTIEADRYFVKSFEYTAFSDEMMFQTIIGEAVYQGGRNDGPVYADFYSDPGRTRVYRSPRDLPYDLHRHHLFVRKIAPVATTFLDQMASYLSQGRTALGASLEQPGLSPESDEAGNPRTRLTIELAAPAELASGAPWQGVERYLQTKFRWTAEERIEWAVHVPAPAPGRICFFLPIVISKPHFLGTARLSFMGQEKPLIYTRHSLIAEFDNRGFSGDTTVTLLTAPPVEAHPGKDPRRVGIGIAV